MEEVTARELASRLMAGDVLWDLRPIPEHMGERQRGAVNLGQVDWLLADRKTERLLDIGVISRVLGRAGIRPGVGVVLKAGQHRGAIATAVSALTAIGVDRIALLREADRGDPRVPGAVGTTAGTAAAGAAAEPFLLA